MKRLIRQGLPLALLGALLAGCATPDKASRSPGMLDAGSLSLADSPGLPATESWWTTLNDPQLNALVRDAFEHSPTLDMALARLDRARAEAGIARSDEGPKIDAGVSADRQRYSRYGLLPEPIGNNYFTTYSLALKGSWDLDLWGRRRAELDAALGKARAAQLDTAEARRAIARAVVAQYTALQRLQTRRTLIDERLQTLRQRQDLTRDRVRAGLVSADALATLATARSQFEQQANDLSHEMNTARHALAELAGKPPGALDGMTAAAPLAPPALPRAGLTANLLGRRPDILARKAEVEAAGAATQAARAAFYPDLSLTAFIGLSSLETGTWMKGDARTMGVTPALTLPIFHSGELKSNLAREEAGRDMAIASYNRTVLAALKEAADALSQTDTAERRLTETAQALQSARQTRNAAQARFKAGLSNRLALLDAIDTELEQASRHTDAIALARLAQADLHTALGGGFATRAPSQGQH
ncbi:efflux transporter outer membrane subunit [Paludibacterium paludis]|uniref:Outer membrane protein n=1 Tax=Paludibacterium paludis TaxID=1225769 RepID=A0A918U9N2_9NEIS|nr:efflux transporter outer membrane subunit [Paludibacterium paludis]GGY16746.1 outer membrane protein [Paludibacterium paludis]